MKNLITCLIVCVLGGVALAQTPNVIDEFKLSTSSGSTDNNSECTDCCGTKVTPERIIQTQEMLANGRWDEGRSRLLNPRGVETQFVKLTIHIVRYSDGTGGIPESRIGTAISDLNDHVDSTGLVFFQHVNTIYLDSDQYADCTSSESNALRTINPVDSSVNVWFVPNFIDLCGRSSFPGSSVQGIVMDNDCTATTYNHSSFTHEVGHYFNLYHTHTTSLGGAECVNGSNCSTAGDLFCDTPADPNLSGNMEPDFSCQYVGTVTDTCGSGNPYDPATDNIMSYANKWCRDVLTQEQLSMFLYTAETDRADHLVPISTGACCVGTSGACVVIPEVSCNAGGGSWQGLGTVCVDGCPIDCPADVNQDGEVNVTDLLAVIDQWGLTDSPADVTGDGIVDVSDLLLIISNWGPCE